MAQDRHQTIRCETDRNKWREASWPETFRVPTLLSKQVFLRRQIAVRFGCFHSADRADQDSAIIKLGDFSIKGHLRAIKGTGYGGRQPHNFRSHPTKRLSQISGRRNIDHEIDELFIAAGPLVSNRRLKRQTALLTRHQDVSNGHDLTLPTPGRARNIFFSNLSRKLKFINQPGKSDRPSAVRAASRVIAGPCNTSPSGANREPWQGQSHDRSALFQCS